MSCVDVRRGKKKKKGEKYFLYTPPAFTLRLKFTTYYNHITNTRTQYTYLYTIYYLYTHIPADATGPARLLCCQLVWK